MNRFKLLIAAVALTLSTVIPALAGGIVTLPASSASVAIEGNTVHAMGGEVRIYTNGGTLVQIITTDLYWISDLVLSPNHRFVAAIGRKQISSDQTTGFVQIIDLLAGRQSSVPVGLCDEFLRKPVSFSPDNVTVAILWSGDVRLFNVVTGQPISHPISELRNHDAVGVQFSEDGNRLLVSSSVETRIYHGMRYETPVVTPTPTPTRKLRGWGIRGRG